MALHLLSAWQRAAGFQARQGDALMKKVETWLNETEYADFIKRARSYGKTPYALLKELVLKEINAERQAIVDEVHFSRN
jgi:SOS response regulatory protein OraA/RecX